MIVRERKSFMMIESRAATVCTYSARNETFA